MFYFFFLRPFEEHKTRINNVGACPGIQLVIRNCRKDTSRLLCGGSNQMSRLLLHPSQSLTLSRHTTSYPPHGKRAFRYTDAQRTQVSKCAAINLQTQAPGFKPQLQITVGGTCMAAKSQEHGTEITLPHSHVLDSRAGRLHQRR